MRIRRKMSLFVLLVVAGIAAGVGIQLYYSARTRALFRLQLQSQAATARFYALADATKAILYTDRPLEELYSDWSLRYEGFTGSLERLFSHEALAQLSGELREGIEATDYAWRRIASSYQNADANFIYLIETDQLDGELKTGLLPLAEELTRQETPDDTVVAKVALNIGFLEEAERESRSFLVESLTVLIDEIDSTAAEQSARDTLFSNLIIGLFALLLATAALLFSRSITRRIGSIEARFSAIGGRDLTVRIEDAGRDELGALATSMRTVVDDLRGFLGSVGEATGRIEELEQTLSAGTTESAAALNEITHNIESLRGLFITLRDQIASSSSAVSSISSQLRELSGDLGRQNDGIGRTSVSISQIDGTITSITSLAEERMRTTEQLRGVVAEGRSKVEETKLIMNETGGELDQLLEIIELINSISDQTNILSINAAIESAHAGEYGRGFAVVAEEIGSLASSTAENSATIKHSLESLVDKIRRANRLSTESFDALQQIEKETATFARAMVDISSSMGQLSAASREILTVTDELASVAGGIAEHAENVQAGGGEIDDAMRTSSNVAHQAAQGIEEIERGAREILDSISEISRVSDTSREQIEELKAVVDSYRV